MQIKFSIALILIFLSLPLSAQRCIPGMAGIKVSAGVVDGFHFNSDNLAYYTYVSYDRYVRSNNKWVFGAEYLQKNYSHECGVIPVASFTADAGYYLNLLSDYSKTLFCSLGGLVITGYETVNWGENILSDGSRIRDKDSFLYGTGVGLDIEGYLNDQWMIFTQIQERMVFGSSVSIFHFQLGIGVKFIFK